MRALARIVSTVGYVGFLPVAPGTWGSVAGLGLLLLLRGTGMGPGVEAAVLALVFAAGVWSATVTGREMGDDDPGPVVIDEVLGMLLTLLWVPLTLSTAVLGFLLFRVFDIVKPPPARQFERAPGGWGVMLDDAMAGLYGLIVVRVALAAAPGWFS